MENPRESPHTQQREAHGNTRPAVTARLIPQYGTATGAWGLSLLQLSFKVKIIRKPLGTRHPAESCALLLVLVPALPLQVQQAEFGGDVRNSKQV